MCVCLSASKAPVLTTCWNPWSSANKATWGSWCGGSGLICCDGSVLIREVIISHTREWKGHTKVLTGVWLTCPTVSHLCVWNLPLLAIPDKWPLAGPWPLPGIWPHKVMELAHKEGIQVYVSSPWLAVFCWEDLVIHHRENINKISFVLHIFLLPLITFLMYVIYHLTV